MLKYNGILKIIMQTIVETLKANRMSLLIFLAQKNKILRVNSVKWMKTGSLQLNGDALSIAENISELDFQCPTLKHKF